MQDFYGDEYEEADDKKRDEMLRNFQKQKATELLSQGRFLYSAREWPFDVRVFHLDTSLCTSR